MGERTDRIHGELSRLFETHELDLSDNDRAELLFLERQSGWQPGRRPIRPEPRIAAFLDLFDRVEQEELAYRTLPAGSLDGLRQVFRERIASA
jgi:hypothetical protein